MNRRQTGDKNIKTSFFGTAGTKRPWTVEEDEKLKDFIMQHGSGNWSQIAETLTNRTGKQCRERWHNHLNPGIVKGDWTENEDRIILTMQRAIGNQWAKITKFLPGRTDNAVKNRFHATTRNRGKTDLDDVSIGQHSGLEEMSDVNAALYAQKIYENISSHQLIYNKMNNADQLPPQQQHHQHQHHAHSDQQHQQPFQHQHQQHQHHPVNFDTMPIAYRAPPVIVTDNLSNGAVSTISTSSYPIASASAFSPSYHPNGSSPNDGELSPSSGFTAVPAYGSVNQQQYPDNQSRMTSAFNSPMYHHGHKSNGNNGSFNSHSHQQFQQQHQSHQPSQQQQQQQQHAPYNNGHIGALAVAVESDGTSIDVPFLRVDSPDHSIRSFSPLTATSVNLDDYIDQWMDEEEEAEGNCQLEIQPCCVMPFTWGSAPQQQTQQQLQQHQQMYNEYDHANNNNSLGYGFNHKTNNQMFSSTSQDFEERVPSMCGLSAWTNSSKSATVPTAVAYPTQDYFYSSYQQQQQQQQPQQKYDSHNNFANTPINYNHYNDQQQMNYDDYNNHSMMDDGDLFDDYLEN